MKKYRISNELLKGVSAEDKVEFKERLVHNKDLLDRIVAILKGKAIANRTAMRDRGVYDKASWPYFQADKLGYERAVSEMLAILTLDREDTNE